MKLLAIVPARQGSKRIHGKNIRHLGGKPLIQWTIETVKAVPSVSDVLVSTDCPVIAQIAKEAGASVPWLRPKELASDEASSISVCMHALEWYEKEKGSVDCLMLLQPTSPFRSASTISNAVEMFRNSESKSLVSFSPAETHPMWCYQIADTKATPFFDQKLPMRSQDLPLAFKLNGLIYLASPEYLKTNNSFIGNDTLPMIVEDPLESIDIDTEWDWFIAESALKRANHLQDLSDYGFICEN